MKDKELNNRVLEDFEIKMSISNFRKDLHIGKQKPIKYGFTKAVATTIMVITLTGATFATTQIINRFDNREMMYSLGSVKDAIDKGYIENIEMEHVYSKDEIGVKVKSLTLSDNDFGLLLDFDFKKANVPQNMFTFGYIAYDENYNVYNYIEPNLSEYNKKLKQFYKDNKITNYNKEDLLGNVYGESSEMSPITVTNESVIMQVNVNSSVKLPKNNKFYLEIFSLGYMEMDLGFKEISKSKWKLELDIPEKFYNRNSIEYKLKENVENFEIISAYVSETSMTVIARTEDLFDSLLNKIKITNEEGEEIIAKTDAYVIDENTFVTTYSLNKYMIPQKLYIQTNIFGKENRTELIKL